MIPALSLIIPADTILISAVSQIIPAQTLLIPAVSQIIPTHTLSTKLSPRTCFSVLPISPTLFDHSDRVFQVFTQFHIAYAVYLYAILVPKMAVISGPSESGYVFSHSTSP